MSSSVDTLLAPIATLPPCGEDLSFSDAFDRINTMRREDDPTLEQGEWKTELKVADWPGVLAECEKLLREQSKDLRVASWWAEARARTQGLAGLAEGLALVDRLVQTYWDAIHPLPDGQDMEQRVGNILWLLRQVEVLATRAPVLVQGRRRYGLVDLDTIRQRPPAPAGSSPGGSIGGETAPSFESLLRTLSAQGESGLAVHSTAVTQARASLSSLQAFLDEKLGSDGPGFTAARKALEAAADGLARLARECGFAGPSATDAPEASASVAASGTPAAGGPAGSAVAGPLQTRAQALQQLRDVAAFFRRTEPHSPVAYLADKAARWGDIPLHTWLRQVVKDDAAISRLEEMLGVEPPQQN